ncbi:MAG: Nudix family hydrolase [Gammaproteobacteria bacterium]|nr:Nudix family hydrolase [Gammaproteobacteria bacterium]
MSHTTHVAVGVIRNPQQQVLLALRPEQAHQGGLWEFPGGKVEHGENAFAALQRELHEELGINVDAARPLIRIHHTYSDKRSDKKVLLDVWHVTEFSGRPFGREQQRVEWVDTEKLTTLAFPAANRPIISAVRLPTRYLITPEPGADHTLFLRRIEQALSSGITLIQLRAKSLCGERYAQLAQHTLERCRQHGAQLLLNSDPSVAAALGADGVHLSSERLMTLQQRPLPTQHWVAASCHNPQQLAQAKRIGVDFAVLAPICATLSHPEATPLGWAAAQTLSEPVNFPLYALGGTTVSDITTAHHHGLQGIAAIRSLWPQF